MPWSRKFDDPITLSDGHKLVTLADAAKFIQKLPKAEHDLPIWQHAVEALMMAAAGAGPVMQARIGVMRALNAGKPVAFKVRRKRVKQQKTRTP